MIELTGKKVLIVIQPKHNKEKIIHITQIRLLFVNTMCQDKLDII